MTRMRKINRTQNFDVELTIHREDFVHPPRAAKRNWLLNRAVQEFADDLRQLDAVASRFVPGSEIAAQPDRERSELDDQQIMEDWQAPLMSAMADLVTASGGDVLEIGFGRGVSATHIQHGGVRSHTIVECNPFIVARYERWRESYPDRDIRLVTGRWQDVVGPLGLFDAVFFHTYALNEDDAIEHLSDSVTFAEPFFPRAAAHLRSGGVFTYLSNEIDSLARSHQRRLLRHFDSFRVHIVSLQIPTDVKDAWWADSMALVEAVK